ncbi:DUF5687 family protein [uncultured Proteiniphilum sp.]|uniref:DUF5687 family protein n=1 Tax=uncultured Proteiniphilum sp. TaxID=497637 RepID=UPI00261A3CF2|nr:DUF5687 family protein [uncultured Proteiniphilum sp.]
MYQILFKHYWLKSIRSPGYYKNLLVNIFMGLTTLYFVVILVMMGFMLPKLLEEIAPQQDPAVIFNGMMIYAVIALLMIRYLIQPLSTLNLENYQVLPVKRDTLVNYLLLKPLFNPLNYVTLCFAIPFAITGIYPAYGTGGALRFIFIVIFLIWFNTLLAPLLKRKFSNIFVGTIVLLTIAGVLAALEYFKIFSLFQLSQHLFGFLVETSFIWIPVVLLSASAFFLNKRYFAQTYYPENVDRKVKKKEADSGRFTFMERFGKIGEIISLEMRLVLRHRRTKKTLYTAIFFLLYGLIFYPSETYNNSPAWLLFIAIFVTGTGMLIFGQWIINWDGAHFDFLMTRNIDTHTYIRANYYLMLALCIASFIATTPYFFFGREIIIYHLVALIYNTGVNIYVYLFGATFNTKRLELSQGSSMNIQGVSYKNFVVMIPLLVIPLMLVILFDLFSAAHIALIIIALLGLAGILFREPLLKMIGQQFLRRKYALCTGFRKKE